MIGRLALCVIVLLWAVPAFADALNEARAAYQGAEAQEKALKARIAEKEATLAAETEALKARVDTRRALITEVRRQREVLARQKLPANLKLRLTLQHTRALAKQWQAIVDRPQSFSSGQRSTIRNDLAMQRRALAAVRGTLRSFERRIAERNRALAAAMLDVEYTRAVTESESRVFLLQTDLGMLNDRLFNTLQTKSAALARFLEASRDSAPPVIDKIEIHGPDGLVFQAIWGRTSLRRDPYVGACGRAAINAEPPLGAEDLSSGMLALHMAELASQIATARDQIKRVEVFIDGYSESIADYIAEEEKLSNEYADAFQEIASLENTVLVANAIVDFSVIAVEVALTGGAATVARKGAEIGVDTLGQIVARRMREEVGEAATQRLVGKNMKAARDEFVDFAARTVPATIEQAQGMAAIRQQARALFDETARAAFREHLGNELLARGAAITLRKVDTLVAQSVTPDLSLAQTPGTRAIKSLGGDFLEFGFDKAIAVGAYYGADSIPTSGRAWKTAGTVVSGLKPQTLKELLPNNPADVAGFVGSVSKAAFTYGIGVKIDEVTQRVLTLQSQYVALHRTHDQMFRERLKFQTDRTELQRLILRAEKERDAILVGMRSNRQLYVPVMTGLTDPDATYVLTISFSKPLTGAPKLLFGAKNVKVSDSTTAVGRADWNATLSDETLRGLDRHTVLEITAQDPSSQILDSSPSHLAVAQLGGDGYHFYAPGPDRCYKIPTDLKQLVLEYEGLKSKYRTR